MRVLLMTAAALSLVTGRSLEGQDEVERALALSVLRPGCEIVVRSRPYVATLPEAIFLSCGGQSFLVVSPLNLLGHVRITSESDALEFVRFFSSMENARFGGSGGGIEVVPRRASDPYSIGTVDEKSFSKYLSLPVVKKIVDKPSAMYSIERSIVFVDQNVYKVTEIVGADGYWRMLSKKFLVKADRVGLAYFGDI